MLISICWELLLMPNFPFALQTLKAENQHRLMCLSNIIENDIRMNFLRHEEDQFSV